jgi:hypothetical protein
MNRINIVSDNNSFELFRPQLLGEGRQSGEMR